MLKALSLYQPYAGAIALGHKTEETRSWPTKHRGPLLIASTQFNKKQHSSQPEWDRFNFLRDEMGEAFYEKSCYVKHCGFLNLEMHFGEALCIVDVVDCQRVAIPAFRDFYQEKPFGFLGDFSLGRYVWFLENIRPLPKPVPNWKGRRGLYDCTEAQIQSIQSLNPSFCNGIQLAL